MDDFINQVKFTLAVAWDNARYEASSHIFLVAGAVAAVLLVLWLFWSKKG